MVRTYVGYTGGQKADPTYHSLGDHTETTQIEYDPSKISYGELLEMFWMMHSPTRPAFSRQYRSAVFYHNAEQREMAEQVKARLEREKGITLQTDIEPAGEFYLAEDYHQKYYLKQFKQLEREFSQMIPNEAEFAKSTATARANGFVGGSGDSELLENEIDDYGLSDSGKKLLRDLAANSTIIKCTN